MEVISAELTEGIVNYVQRKVILAVLLTGSMENHCCSSFHLAYARCKKGVEQVCIIFATCSTLRGLDVLSQDCSLSNDFLNSSLFF